MIEMRLYARKMSREDLRQGMIPVRLGPPSAIDLYHQPILQYRYKQRVTVKDDASGQDSVTVEYTQWIDVPVELEP
jgi:hypothetical protein